MFSFARNKPIRLAAAAVKAPDELAALGLDSDPRRPSQALDTGRPSHGRAYHVSRTFSRIKQSRFCARNTQCRPEASLALQGVSKRLFLKMGVCAFPKTRALARRGFARAHLLPGTKHDDQVDSTTRALHDLSNNNVHDSWARLADIEFTVVA